MKFQYLIKINVYDLSTITNYYLLTDHFIAIVVFYSDKSSIKLTTLVVSAHDFGMFSLYVIWG